MIIDRRAIMPLAVTVLSGILCGVDIMLVLAWLPAQRYWVAALTGFNGLVLLATAVFAGYRLYLRGKLAALDDLRAGDAPPAAPPIRTFIAVPLPDFRRDDPAAAPPPDKPMLH
jgi:hypothetical protein